MNDLDDVVAVVLTHRRPRMATAVVRELIDHQKLGPHQILVVVNGEGGLQDADLERQVSFLRLPQNIGPAGGYAAALDYLSGSGARWAYLCEDDIGHLDMPENRVSRLLESVQAQRELGTRVDAVAAYARTLDWRTGSSRPITPSKSCVTDLIPADVAAWGASLLDLELVNQGLLPDDQMFFGYEDFDFWLGLRQRGGRLFLDIETATQVHASAVMQREALLSEQRPTDRDEPWRRYYEARNFFVLWRRYGTPLWILSHMVKSARRFQIGPTWAHRRAVVVGFFHGMVGRVGKNPRYVRTTGEWRV